MSEGLERVPFFSVIVTSFHAGDRLKNTIENILDQECGDLEIVIQDGLSADDSVRKLGIFLGAENLAQSAEGQEIILPDKTGEAKIRFLREKDAGIYDGMNRAVQRARGRFLYFLNCGDLLHDKEVLSKVREEICKKEKDPAKDTPAVYYGNVLEVRSGEEVAANPEMTDYALFRNIPCHQACFYDRRLFEERAFDLRYRVRADYEHFLWAHYRAGARMIFLPLLIADYEGGGFSETEEGRRISAKEHREITETYMPKELVKKYRRRMLYTLQPLREVLAHAPLTKSWYNALKRRAYGQKIRNTENP